MLTVPMKVFTPGLVHSPSSVQRTSARSVWPFLIFTVTCAGSGSTVVTPEPAPSGGTIAPNTLCVVTNAEGGLRIRSGPGTSSAVIGSLKNGARVVVLDEGTGGWYQILFVHNGQAAIGYVSADYLTLNQ
mgnify:CR=1 FL=1